MDSSEWYLRSERKQCRSFCFQPCRNAAMPNESTNKICVCVFFFLHICPSSQRIYATCQTMVIFCVSQLHLHIAVSTANKNPLNVEMKYESSANDVIRIHLVRRRRRRPRGIHFRGKPFMESFSVACQRKANFERILQINVFGWLLPYGAFSYSHKKNLVLVRTNKLIEIVLSEKISSGASWQNHVSVSITY